MFCGRFPSNAHRFRVFTIFTLERRIGSIVLVSRWKSWRNMTFLIDGSPVTVCLCLKHVSSAFRILASLLASFRWPVMAHTRIQSSRDSPCGGDVTDRRRTPTIDRNSRSILLIPFKSYEAFLLVREFGSFLLFQWWFFKIWFWTLTIPWNLWLLIVHLTKMSVSS